MSAEGTGRIAHRDVLRRLRRWWRELRRPSLKCARVGHALRVRRREGYAKPGLGYFRAVAVEATDERTTCRRCGEQSDWRRVWESGIQSLSMPSDMMHTMEQDGAVWIREYTP